jgi:hypothetical protein
VKFLKKKHCMVDLETLNSTTDAIILSIGACTFNFTGDGIQEKFYVNVDPQDCKTYGLTSSKDTIKWWVSQSKEVLRAFKSPEPVPLVDALTAYYKFFTDNGCDFIWCHGQFDIPILELASTRAGIVPAYKYWQHMDNRTVMTLLDSNPPRDKNTHHNAVEDAMAQAYHLVTLFEQPAF